MCTQNVWPYSCLNAATVVLVNAHTRAFHAEISGAYLHIRQFSIDLPIQKYLLVPGQFRLQSLLHQRPHLLLRHVIQIHLGQTASNSFCNCVVVRPTVRSLEVDRADRSARIAKRAAALAKRWRLHRDEVVRTWWNAHSLVWVVLVVFAQTRDRLQP